MSQLLHFILGGCARHISSRASATHALDAAECDADVGWVGRALLSLDKAAGLCALMNATTITTRLCGPGLALEAARLLINVDPWVQAAETTSRAATEEHPEDIPHPSVFCLFRLTSWASHEVFVANCAIEGHSTPIDTAEHFLIDCTHSLGSAALMVGVGVIFATKNLARAQETWLHRACAPSLEAEARNTLAHACRNSVKPVLSRHQRSATRLLLERHCRVKDRGARW